MSETLPLSASLSPPDDAERRLWLIGTGVAGGVAAAATPVPFVPSLAPN